VNPSLRSLTALVLIIFAGTALTVGSYLASKRPIPAPEGGIQESESLQSPDASEQELEASCPVSGRTVGECDREVTS
jgi:hypothetical protein